MYKHADKIRTKAKFSKIEKAASSKWLSNLLKKHGISEQLENAKVQLEQTDKIMNSMQDDLEIVISKAALQEALFWLVKFCFTNLLIVSILLQLARVLFIKLIMVTLLLLIRQL